jgi:hypothetical protein
LVTPPTQHHFETLHLQALVVLNSRHTHTHKNSDPFPIHAMSHFAPIDIHLMLGGLSCQLQHDTATQLLKPPQCRSGPDGHC